MPIKSYFYKSQRNSVISTIENNKEKSGLFMSSTNFNEENSELLRDEIPVQSITIDLQNKLS